MAKTIVYEVRVSGRYSNECEQLGRPFEQLADALSRAQTLVEDYKIVQVVQRTTHIQTQLLVELLLNRPESTSMITAV